MNDFYKNLKSFLKELVSLFPDDHEIKVITTSINLAIMEEQEIIIERFYKSLFPLEYFIDTRNDKFFQENYWDTSSEEYRLFNKLNELYNFLEQHNKKIFWDYIQVLYNLSKKEFV